MEWTDIRLTVAKRDADTAEAIATMIADGGIYIEVPEEGLIFIGKPDVLALIDEAGKAAG